MAASATASAPPAPFPAHPSLYLLSGAVAGLSVDCVLFPLDTIKTRMQSARGLAHAGGFGKLFSGVASAAAGSAPTAALFFLTYESSKAALTPLFHPATPSSPSASSLSAPSAVNPLVHCLSASLGEVVACMVRVPTENVKQKVQAGLYSSSIECFRALARGPVSGFYRGFSSTILREIPFAFIQFPLYEFSKHRLEWWINQRDAGTPGRSRTEVLPWQSALLGSAAGGVAAALTTPLDVVKTRLMLQQGGPRPAAASASASAALPSAARPAASIPSIFRTLLAEGGVPRLFSGVVPRVLWISIGGFVFFGAYEATKKKLRPMYER